MQYKASLWLQIIGTFGITGIEFLGMWALFERFNSIKGWTMPEVALLYGAVNIIFSIADAITTGFDRFANMVKMGEFDRILLKPRSTVLQLFGYELTIRRIGRFTQGLIVFIWALQKLHINFTLLNALLFLFSFIGGTIVFTSIFIFQATLSFWTVESIEVMNTMSYGGVAAATYPLTIYKRFLRTFFMFIVPIGMTIFIPMSQLLEKDVIPGLSSWVGFISPLAGVIFFIISLLFWRFGIKHYTSTGS
jgi:ABC-2 type transport system permease protein